MRILVFGKNKKPRSAPGKVTKSLAIETYPISDLASMVPSLQDGTLVYLDLEGLAGPQREKVLTVIPDNPHLLFGVVDPTGFVADVAALFHVGAVDYIGRKMRGNRRTLGESPRSSPLRTVRACWRMKGMQETHERQGTEGMAPHPRCS